MRSDEYISQTDEAELQRLTEMSRVNGLGDTVDFQDDTEVTGFLEEFGFNREAGEK